MEIPTERQIAEAIADSALAGESETELHERVESMCRLSDDDLAAMGIVPTAARPELVEGPEPASVLEFAPVPVKRRHDGWTAERQRTFIQCLAETGCVRTACGEIGLSARSAYKLREHPRARAFRDAWDHATSLATARLASIAFDRAINGSVERIYRNGALFEERRRPSDRLLMFLLSHHNPVSYGWLSKPPRDATDKSFYFTQEAQRQLPKLLGKLADIAPEDSPVEQVGMTDLDTLEEPDQPC